MSKPNIWRDKIYEVLNNKSLNYYNLFKLAKKDLNESRRPERLFNEQLVKLLKEGKIKITGYDESVHKNNKGDQVKKIQAFKKEGMIFEIIRMDETEPIDIILLLKQLEDIESSDEQIEARKELLTLFGKKYRQYEEQKLTFYEHMKKKVIIEPLVDWIKKDEKTLEKLISKYNGDPGKDPTITRFKDNLETYRSLRDKYPNARMLNLESLTTKEYDTILKLNGKKRLSIRELGEKSRLRVSSLDEKGSYTIEQFLETKGIYQPEERKTSHEIRKIFSSILFFINSHENYNFMKQSFSWAISDEEDSLEWFELFINNLTLPNEKLKDKLGIERPDERTFYEKIGQDPFGRKMDKPEVDQFATFIVNKLMTEFKEYNGGL